MIRLEDILPGDEIVDICNHVGVVCSVEGLDGGKYVWAMWSTMKYNRPLFVFQSEIKEHRPKVSQYDPTQQPWDESDI